MDYEDRLTCDPVRMGRLHEILRPRPGLLVQPEAVPRQCAAGARQRELADISRRFRPGARSTAARGIGVLPAACLQGEPRDAALVTQISASR